MYLFELLETLDEVPPTYSQLLSTTEWNLRRNQILNRDRHYCSNCGKSKSFFYENELYCYDKNQLLEFELDGNLIFADKVIVDDKSRYLQIHHNYYVLGTLPWNYDDNALITFCNWCHWEFHQNESVPIYSRQEYEYVILEYHPCKRCNGAGVFPEYKHVQSGTCFRCNGSKYEELIKSPHKLWM
ncbi:hypothetical protein [Aquirufa sp. Wall-65K1]